MKIFLDAGHNHSGHDTGAQGNGLREQDVTYYLAQKVGARLKKSGHEVMCSRNNITDNLGTTLATSLEKRVSMANACGAELFVSIHCNAASPLAQGTETFVYSAKSAANRVANSINNRLSSIFVNRGVKVNSNLYVLKHTKMPALLIEVGFITNETDTNKLRNRQDEIADLITKGIIEVYGGDYMEIKTAEQALDVIISNGVDTDKQFWLKACEYVKYLDALLIKIAKSYK